jgi:hypothetical protein
MPRAISCWGKSKERHSRLIASGVFVRTDRGSVFVEKHQPVVAVLFLFGCGVIRRYGFTVFQPAGNLAFASSSLRDGTMMQSSPSFQFTGVATL